MMTRKMDDQTPKMYVFYCANSVGPEELVHFHDRLQGDSFKEVRLPCSGKVNIPYLVKAFEAGADGVVIVTCKQDECRRIEGNMRAQKRAQAVDSLLEEVGLGSGRIAVIQMTDGVDQIIEDIEGFCAKVRMLGPRDHASLPHPSAIGGSPVASPRHQENPS
ncbi:MAG: hydrogenase iron-sulfur subunit [Sedimentisphaerales bacterium]